MMKLTTLVILVLMVSTGMALADSTVIILRDKNGNYNGAVRQVPNTKNYNVTDKNGNHIRSYRKVGSMTYVYDKNGNCIGSFRE